MHELSLAVVGIRYPNPEDGSDRRFELELLAPGDPVELRREPKHRHDEFAVGVFAPSGIRVGYLPAERAPWVGAKMLDGLEVHAVFQAILGDIGVIRARLGGGAPVLPPARKRPPQSDPDFYPDEDGPEWGA